MSEEQKRKLEQQLWNIADTLRGRMDADEFRDYILGFIFFKYLSEKQYIYANELLDGEDVTDYKQLTDKESLEAIKEESLEKLGYYLPPCDLFSSIAKKGQADKEGKSNFIIEDLQRILNEIEQSTMGTDSEDDFNKLFEDLDLNSTKLGRTPENRNGIIAKVLNHLDAIDFELANSESDVLGDAYEYMIGKFASGAGKKAGEFYTPQQISKILAKLVTTGKKRLRSVYDPTCGSGSLLLRIGKEAEVSEYYGQELNRTTYNLCRMNMILHDVHYSKFDIQQEDTLEDPRHSDKRFEAVVANPPFSAHWKGKDNPLNNTDDRFSQYGKLAPSTKADFAFVQHMIYQLADNGTMACILPHGVLFRGAAEGTIREYLIKDLNYLDAVIGLPANLFYGTSIPTCILVLRKCRTHPDDILFIDASADFVKEGNQNALTDEHVDKIISTYRQRINIDRYSHVAPLDEIAENDYNLNIPRYVDTFVHEAPVDLAAVSNLLSEGATKLEENNKIINSFCQELNIPKPCGFNIPLLELYKRGAMQQIFSQQLRFKDKNGKDYSDWEEKKLGEIAKRITCKNTEINTNVLTISAQQGLINQLKFFNNSVAAKNLSGYYLLHKGDFAYNKSYSNGYPMGAIKRLKNYPKGIVSTLYICFRNKDNFDNSFAEQYFESGIHNREIEKVAQEGARNHGLLNVGVNDFFDTKILLPCLPEQQQIADFLSAIDNKIALCSQQITQAEQYKKGLLQQMFV